MALKYLLPTYWSYLTVASKTPLKKPRKAQASAIEAGEVEIKPSLHHKHSIDSLKSFYESDEEATSNGYRGNQCYSIHQALLQEAEQSGYPDGPGRQSNKQDNDVGGPDQPCNRVCKKVALRLMNEEALRKLKARPQDAFKQHQATSAKQRNVSQVHRIWHRNMATAAGSPKSLKPIHWSYNAVTSKTPCRKPGKAQSREYKRIIKRDRNRGRQKMELDRQQGYGRERGQERSFQGSSQCHYCGHFNHHAYAGCFKNQVSTIQGTYVYAALRPSTSARNELAIKHHLRDCKRSRIFIAAINAALCIKCQHKATKKEKGKFKKVREEEKRRSQTFWDAGHTSKTMTLEGLINPAIKSASKQVAPQLKNEESLKKI
uniref:Uncharacterized protein n=1 Tax=Plectus sambesii TaxID=2011161 RepID=A0A914WCZ6_9BILA